MKRFITVLSSLLVLPAFAEVAPVYYDDFVEYSDEMIDDEDVVEESVQQQKNVKNTVQRTSANRSGAASRTIATSNKNVSQRANASSRAVASSPRATTSRATASRTARTANVISRQPTTVSRASVSSRNVQNAKPVTARVGTSNNSVIPGNRTIRYSSQATLTDSGAPLYNPNTAAGNAARVSVANRRATARVSSAALTTTPQNVITEEDISTTTSNLTAVAELTDYCKAQYAACMDNYCNVLDDSQGRCSCSKNLKNYSKTEAALEKATEDYQDAIQKIRYIGLTSSQIESLFSETEAELALKSNTDSSRMKNNLEAIKRSIVDVSSPTSTAYTASSNVTMDSFGLFNADFTNASGTQMPAVLNLAATATNTATVSNQRGEQLYKTAANRCKSAVLDSCVAQGIDANIITNSYDLEIDKQCIAYERTLNERNTEMRLSIRNAEVILEQARLMLTANKNAYDLRECVAAIDSCMQDDYVCGADYELCLDPTGKYLANGAIVKGGTPGVSGGQNKNKTDLTADTLDSWTSGGMYSLYSTWNYDNNKNAWGAGSKETLGEYIDKALSDWKTNYKKETLQSSDMATYLLQKIGYIDADDKVHGMCASEMKQCQNYTFDNQKANKKYLPVNDVVRQYLNSTLAKIKVEQDNIVSEYAEGCRNDVQSCLSSNGYDESNTQSTASKTAVNACAAEITTCMSVGGYQVTDGVKLTLRAMTDWVSSMLINCPVNTYLVDDGIGKGTELSATSTTGTAVSCKPCGYPAILDSNGEDTDDTTDAPATSAGGQVTRCSCPTGYNDYIDTDGSLKGCVAEN